MKIKKSSFYLIAVSIVVVLIASGIFLASNPQNENKIEKISSESLETRFALLSSAHSSLCAGPSFINSKTSEDRLQGACCSAMDIHRYSEQVNGLKKYSGVSVIPSDPYDIPVVLAKELLSYRNIELTEEQQKVYNDAMNMSHEGGPCCCKCWRWYAFEGQAKYLITKYNFNAEQIAEVWDLEDGCGGKGHAAHESTEEHNRQTFEPQ